MFDIAFVTIYSLVKALKINKQKGQKMQRLLFNSKGFALHAILPLILVIAVVGGVGAYVLNKSSAAKPGPVGSVTCSIVAKPKPSKGRYTAITVSIKNNTANTINTALAQIGDNNALMEEITLGDIAPWATSSGTRDVQVRSDSALLRLQGGTPNSDFENCSKTWNL